MITPYYQDDFTTIFHGDALFALKNLQSESVNCCVTSPPYWGLRCYLPDQVQLKNGIPKGDIEKILKELTLLGIKGILR